MFEIEQISVWMERRDGVDVATSYFVSRTSKAVVSFPLCLKGHMVLSEMTSLYKKEVPLNSFKIPVLEAKKQL